MIDNNLVEYNLPKNAYASFDAMSMKQLIIDKLNTNAIFRDQNYEGSNLNSIIDIIAYMYHVLLFNLNQAASETVFTQATIYENMNKIVSLLNYKPTGQQTSLAEFTTTAGTQLDVGPYLVRKFSYIPVNGYNYALVGDLSFEKTKPNEFETVATNNINLVQGTVTEYPSYFATGENFEVVFIAFSNLVNPNDGGFIADNTIRVYVKETADNKWYEYTETPSLYLNNISDRVYEKRFNENGRYELKFGDNSNGKRLDVGDEVAVYFVVSDGAKGLINEGDLDGKQMLFFNTSRFNSIVADLYTDVNLITPSQLRFLSFSNRYPSTPISDAETVDQIRSNAPKLFSTQNRAVTLNDYKTIVDKNFGYAIASSQAINNNVYVNNYQRYFYELGLSQPNKDTSVLVNQFNFMTSTNFNNVYIFMVPRFGTIRNETSPVSLSVAQKQLVVNELNKVKSASHEVVPMDPIYKAFSFGLLQSGELPTFQATEQTVLVLKRSQLSTQSREKIKNDAVQVVSNYFNVDNCQLGQIVDLTKLSNTLLAVDGVGRILTRRVTPTNTFEVPTISMIYWNPNYSTVDINVAAQNIPLQVYEFPFFYQQSLITNKIIVEDE